MPARSRAPAGIPGPWRYRLDLQLPNAHTLALIHDCDGELVLRVLERQGDRNVFVTPKVRVVEADLADLLEGCDLVFQQPPILINLWGDMATVLANGKLAGTVERNSLSRIVSTFLGSLERE